MPSDSAQRSSRARIAALSRSARTSGSEISEPARTAFRNSFDTGGQPCRLCGTHAVIDPQLAADERMRRSAASYSAHMARVSARARAAREQLRQVAEVLADAEQLASEAL